MNSRTDRTNQATLILFLLIFPDVVWVFGIPMIHKESLRGKILSERKRTEQQESLQPLLSRNKRDSDSSDSSEENHIRHYHYQRPRPNQFMLSLILLLSKMRGGGRPNPGRRPGARPSAGASNGGSQNGEPGGDKNSPDTGPDPPIEPPPEPPGGTDQSNQGGIFNLFGEEDPMSTFPNSPLVQVPPPPPSHQKKRIPRRRP